MKKVKSRAKKARGFTFILQDVIGKTVTPVWKAARGCTGAQPCEEHTDIPWLFLAGLQQSPSTTETALRLWGAPDQGSEEQRSGWVLHLQRLPLTTRKPAECGKRPRQQIRGSRCPGSPGKLLNSCLPERWFCGSCFQLPGPKEWGGGGNVLCKMINQVHIMV